MRHPGEEAIPISAKYYSLRFRVPANDDDRFLAAVWSFDTLGLEVRDLSGGDQEYLTYFRSPPDPAAIRSIEGQDRPAGTRLLGQKSVVEDDWQRQYRLRSVPFALGERWWVDPGEPNLRRLDPEDRRYPLRIPARTAFGTGSHASTSLMVDLMDGLSLVDTKVLDVGTGSGILAMIALASGARSVTAFDVDPAATCIARQTCRLNGFTPSLFAGSVAALRTGSSAAKFDVIVANVLPANLRADLSRVVDCLSPNGVLLVSGLLKDQENERLASLEALGLRARGRRSAQEWLALSLERAGS